MIIANCYQSPHFFVIEEKRRADAIIVFESYTSCAYIRVHVHAFIITMTELHERANFRDGN